MAILAVAAVPLAAQNIPWYRATNITELAKINLGRNSVAQAVVVGRDTGADAGGGIWYFDSTSLRATNTHSVVKTVGNTNIAGRWIKLSLASLAPQELYQPQASVTGNETTYALNLFRGNSLTKSNYFGLGSDDNSTFLQSFSGKGLWLLPAGNTLNIGPGGSQLRGVYSQTATLDFPSVPANSTTNLTISVPGAAVGDTVHLGPPATVLAGINYLGYVSATDTVQVRAVNVTTGPLDPASATFRATVIHY